MKDGLGMMKRMLVVAAGLAGLAGMPQAAPQVAADASALACTVAYQVDWEKTTSPERRAADRKGAEITFEAWRREVGDGRDPADDVRTRAPALTEQVEAGAVDLGALVAACDRAWSGNAAAHAPQYAAKPEPAPAISSEPVTFENTEAREAKSDAQPATSRQCEITDARATGIINLWTTYLSDYVNDSERDYAIERELRSSYDNLRSRLQDELGTAETYGCHQLASDIRYALGEWEFPF